jgi:hypothetical protein
VANDFDDIVVKQPGGRITGVRVRVYTFAAADTLTFAIPDNYLPDNNGGVSVVISPTADYNGDGKINAADYVLWRKNPSTYGGNPAGYNTWRANFGLASGSGSAASANASVPEPSTSLLLMFAATGWCLRRGQATSKVPATHQRVILVKTPPLF